MKHTIKADTTQEQLTKKICRECGKEILVVEYSPHPLEGEATGMAAEMWDSDHAEYYFVGWICLTCAWMRAGNKDGQGFISGPPLTFAYC